MNKVSGNGITYFLNQEQDLSTTNSVLNLNYSGSFQYAANIAINGEYTFADQTKSISSYVNANVLTPGYKLELGSYDISQKDDISYPNQ